MRRRQTIDGLHEAVSQRIGKILLCEFSIDPIVNFCLTVILPHHATQHKTHHHIRNFANHVNFSGTIRLQQIEALHCIFDLSTRNFNKVMQFTFKKAGDIALRLWRQLVLVSSNNMLFPVRGRVIICTLGCLSKCTL